MQLQRCIRGIGKDLPREPGIGATRTGRRADYRLTKGGACRWRAACPRGEALEGHSKSGESCKMPSPSLPPHATFPSREVTNLGRVEGATDRGAALCLNVSDGGPGDCRAAARVALGTSVAVNCEPAQAKQRPWGWGSRHAETFPQTIAAARSPPRFPSVILAGRGTDGPRGQQGVGVWSWW